MKKIIKICIVRSEYNETSKLLQSAIKELKKRKIIFKILKVPGAFEIPVIIVRNIKKYDGFIALGSIIKGQTPNFDFISSAIILLILKLQAITPPKALIGSQAYAFLKDTIGDLFTETPQGLLCLMITVAALFFKENRISKEEKISL